MASCWPELRLNFSKIRDLEEELKIVGNSLKSLEASEASVSRDRGSLCGSSRRHFIRMCPYPTPSTLYRGVCTKCLYVVFKSVLLLDIYSKILELEEELKVVGNNMKSLEISEQEVVKHN